MPITGVRVELLSHSGSLTVKQLKYYSHLSDHAEFGRDFVFLLSDCLYHLGNYKASPGVPLVASLWFPRFPALPSSLRSGIIHVWVACPREGHPHRYPAAQVSVSGVASGFLPGIQA